MIQIVHMWRLNVCATHFFEEILMKLAKYTSALIAAALGFLLLASTSFGGQRAENEWNRILRQQLLTEKSCKLSFITAFRELEIKGQFVMEGRAHCEDKRLFNFVRNKPRSKFAITACKPDVC